MPESRLEERVAKLEGRVEGFDHRFDGLERRLEALDQKMTRHFTWTVGIQVAILLAVVAALA